MGEPVIAGAVRTAIGKRGGAFRDVRPDTLLASILNALADRTGIERAWVEDVVVGCVTQVGEQGANIARQAVLLAGYPMHVPASTVNRMCGSSQQAVHFAAQAVAAGDMRWVVAAGVESMTRVPMFSDILGASPQASAGQAFAGFHPELLTRYELIHQGESAERIAERYGLGRRELDEFSFQSHVRAARAIRAGYFESQIVPVEGLDAQGNTVTVIQDEGVRLQPSLERMLGLAPAFRPPGRGVVTAGNSSQISDGAAAILVADSDAARAAGIRPRARFLARVAVAGDPTLQLLEVVPATRRALEKAGVSLRDLDVIEINEAFASVVLAWGRELEPDWERVNPNGGAIAHGHPLGATGAVLMTKLLHELERRDGTLGLQVMCIGHGMATATVLERL